MPSMLDDADLDARWRTGLEAAAEPGETMAAESRVSHRIARHRRTRVATTVCALAVVGALVIGVVIAFAVDDTTKVRTATPPVATIAVVAEPDLTLSLSRTVVPAGIIEVDYSTNGGTHTLVIDGVPGFQLSVPGSSAEHDVGRVRLEPGQYVLQCIIPGHQAAGERVTLTVT
jgi:hypothetical protein